uniref:Uncharacterized protein n=1 Tax=Anguilla anguilla TaxID=7936 RepID=A0A0E9XBJ2_ANGAN
MKSIDEYIMNLFQLAELRLPLNSIKSSILMCCISYFCSV